MGRGVACRRRGPCRLDPGPRPVGAASAPPARFADRLLVAITRFDVERMANEIVAAGRSPVTAEKALRTLSAIMSA
ncbi:MAG: hypothetical protein M3276_07060, partial [Actinomycetota bacterium]|nr:hypothetical protein [Actinomycetota bacterium]